MTEDHWELLRSILRIGKGRMEDQDVEVIVDLLDTGYLSVSVTKAGRAALEAQDDRRRPD
jgi:hypothetical protein